MSNGHSILFFFFWLGHNLGLGLGPNLVGLNGARRGGSEPRKKNPISKRAESRPQAKTHKSGSGMEKPGPNPTRCHSYFLVLSKSVNN